MKYKELAELYEKLEKTSSRLDKTQIIAEFLKKVKHENPEILYLLRGRLFPDYDTREIGISDKLVIKALSKLGINEKEIVKKWKSIGDLGLVAEEIAKQKRQKSLFSKELTVDKVLDNLKKLTEQTGKGSVDKKIDLISELLTSSSPIEAKFITRTLLSDLRIGLGEGVLRDSIVYACFNKEDKQAYEQVQSAYDKMTDFALVFQDACKGKKHLEDSEITPGRPIKVMLAPKAESLEDGFERCGKPCAFEYKYDGFRMVINKDEHGVIKIFTRRLEQVTAQFPEVIEYVKKYVNAKTFILDSEAVGFDPKTKQYKPFQEISQRIKRKYDIKKIQSTLPVEINIFDILYYNGKSQLNTPFGERRKLLEKIIKEKKFQIVLAKHIETDKKEIAEKFYHQALKDRQEGIMIKNLNSPYKPGARVGHMLKFKPNMNELDLVITGAEYGTGKRAGWLSSFDVSCQDNGKLLEIGKVSTGLKEITRKKEDEDQGTSFEELSNKLKKLITKTNGKHVSVKPDIIVTIAYQNIQHSPTYNSGFALRFPRFITLRPDRSKSDIATLQEIKKESEKERLNYTI